MSRNATKIAHGALQHLTTHGKATTAPNRLFSHTVSTSRLFTPFTPPSRLWSRAASTYHHATTADTNSARLGTPAIIAGAGYGRAALSKTSAGHARLSEHTWTQAQIWRQQRRLYSDKKPSQIETIAKEPRKSAHQLNSEPSPNAPQDHISTNNNPILSRLPHLHRPTKDELLAAATGFWQRLGIRFKWFSIRSFRPYTPDEIGAFVSWVFLGHLVWIVIGTTTFVSLAIWAVNTVFAQETLAEWVGNYLTKSSGIKIMFESAIVPTWKSGVITFNNVFVSRRPGDQVNRKRSVRKGSAITAAAAAEAAMAADRTKELSGGAPEDDDGNYTQFDVTINTVNVTLSFSKWFNGKGLLRDVEIIGVRGVIDRTHILPAETYVDPKSYRHEHNTGDFEIDDFKMSDVLLTVHQPRNFRPFNVSVFNCSLPRLRKQWLFYDFMSANSMSGSFDESLFTVHPRQVHGMTGADLTTAEERDRWKKHSRLRIDGLKIDHLNRGVEGPFSWIHEGNVDLVADVMIPNDEDGVWKQSWRRSAEAMSELYDSVTNASQQQQSQQQRTSDQASSAAGGAPATTSSTVLQNTTFHLTETSTETEADKRLLILSLTIHLNDVRASVPLFTKDLSYVNNALVRPIVAYINTRRALIPVTCRVVKRQSEFDGSWTIFDSGLLEDVSRETYEAFARDVLDGKQRQRRMRKVGWWSLQVVSQALFLGLAGQLA